MARQGQFQKGNKAATKRGPNKITKTVKETVLAVFNEIQDDPKVKLLAFAKQYPRDFYAIAAKLIPTEVDAKLKSDIPLVQFYLPDNGRNKDNNTTEGVSRESA